MSPSRATYSHASRYTDPPAVGPRLKIRGNPPANLIGPRSHTDEMIRAMTGAIPLIRTEDACFTKNGMKNAVFLRIRENTGSCYNHARCGSRCTHARAGTTRAAGSGAGFISEIIAVQSGMVAPCPAAMLDKPSRRDESRGEGATCAANICVTPALDAPHAGGPVEVDIFRTFE